MSRRSQRLDILTAAGLAESERDREIREGQRSAETTSRWAGALSSLIPAGIDGASKAYGAAEDNAVNEATAYAAENADVASAGDVSGLLDANPELAEKKDGGILDYFTAKPIRAKARATAATALASSAKANTATREAKAAADGKAALEQKRYDATAQNEATAAAAKRSEVEAKGLEQKRADAVANVRGAMQQGMPRADLERVAASVGLTPEALLLRADETSTATNLEQDKTTSEVTKNNALAKKAGAPKPGPSPEAIARAEKKDKKLDLEIAALEGRAVPDSAPLRDDFQKQPAVKAFNEVAVSFDKMKTAAANPSPASDMSLVFSFMKMLDPGSTVREGEFASAQNAGGVDTQVLNAYNKAKSGTILDDAQRKDFLGQAANFYAAHKRARDIAAAQYSKLAEKKKIDAADVVGAGDDEDDPFADTRGGP